MKVETKRGSDAPIIKVEETDSRGILDLRQLMSGEFMCERCQAKNKIAAWETLQGYYSSLRLWIEEMGKTHAQSRAKKDLCDNDFSILTGIDLAIGLPKKLIAQSDMMDKIHKEREDKNDVKEEPNEYGD